MRALDAKRMTGSENSPLRREDGFTVVEALVATFVLLAGLLSVVGVFDDSRDQNATGERTEIGLLQAEQAVEELLGIPYDHLMLNAGAVDPGTGRVATGGADFNVKPGLSEQLVYHSSEGRPQSDAWVDPTTTVTVGGDDAPLTLTIHRFVTWRDEECRVADLSGLGLEDATDDLLDLIDQVQAPLTNLVNNLLTSLLNLLGSDPAINALKARLQDLNDSLLGHESQLTAAVSGIAELDLCDLQLGALGKLQNLGRLLPALSDPVHGLTRDLNDLTGALDNLLGSICLPLIGCPLSSITDEVADVNNQLDCMFGNGSAEPQFDAYLDDLLGTLNNLAADVSDTAKNTKRVTVAVVVEPREGVGPTQPIWASSVMRDPSAGLLSSGSATCQ